MVKLVLNDVGSLQSEPSALQTMADNNDKIETAFENTLSRDGTGPNQMEAPLDLNSNRLINLGAPQSGSDAARLTDVREALVFEGVLVPALVTDFILSNDGVDLVWRDALTIPGIGDLKSINNLSELTDQSVARSNLGLGSSATYNIATSGGNIPLLDGNNTHSGNNTFSGSTAFSGPVTLGGTVNHVITTTPTVLTETSIGTRVPRVNIRDATYTIELLDSGGSIVHTSASAHTWTIPPQASVAFPGTTQILLVNSGSGVVTIARGAGVALRQAATATDKNMSLAQHTVATLVRSGANSWYIIGAGVS